MLRSNKLGLNVLVLGSCVFKKINIMALQAFDGERYSEKKVTACEINPAIYSVNKNIQISYPIFGPDIQKCYIYPLTDIWISVFQVFLIASVRGW